MSAGADTLVALLAPDYNIDYWADDVRPRAGGELDALDDAEWSRLTELSPEQPASWRVRLAEALHFADAPRSVGLLVDLMGSPEPEVGAAAAEALLEKRYEWDPDVPLRIDVDRHLQQADGRQREPLERLARRLPS
jgi:hypothetical protein